MEFFVYLYCVKAYTGRSLLAILIEMVCLYAWASGAKAKFAGMPRKLKFYQKKSAERHKKLRKLIVVDIVLRLGTVSYPCIRILYLCCMSQLVITIVAT